MNVGMMPIVRMTHGEVCHVHHALHTHTTELVLDWQSDRYAVPCWKEMPYDALSVNDRTNKLNFISDCVSYLFFYVEVDTMMDVVMLIETNIPAKLWVNDKIVALHQRAFNFQPITFTTSSGVVVLETHKSDEIAQIAIRCCDYKCELKSSLTSLLWNNVYRASLAAYVYTFCIEDRIYINANLYDRLGVQGLPTVLIIHPFTGETIDRRVIEWDNTFIYDMPCELMEFLHCIVRISFCHIDNPAAYVSHLCFIKDKQSVLEQYRLNISHNISGNEQICLATEYLYRQLAQKDVYENKLLELLEEYGACISENSSSRKRYWRYFRSKVDGTVQAYHVSEPDEIIKKEYPLVIIHDFNGKFDTILPSMPISAYVVTIGARGVTFGSYVGDIAIQEQIQILMNTLPIDKNRIYGIGASNGASAVWIDAQNHPERYAAICTFSGFADRLKLVNLRNTSIINVSSDFDDERQRNFVNYDYFFRDTGNYTSLQVNGVFHHWLLLYMGKIDIYKKMLSCVLCPYPNFVDFITYDHAHNKAYWIFVDEIMKMKRYGIVKAKWSKNCLNIITHNISALSVQLPICGIGDELTINISHKTIRISTKNRSHIHFSQDACGYWNEVEKNKSSDTRKGFGMLSVFRQSLLVIPAIQDEKLASVAKTLSSPQLYTYANETYTLFPVVMPNQCLLNKEKDLIVLDVNVSIWEEYCDALIVEMDELGFMYKNKRYNGNYLVMQIVRQKNNPQFNVLYINTNDIKLYSVNLFMRRFILPAYYAQKHPYLNHFALIHFENKYYRIEEEGMDLEICTKK